MHISTSPGTLVEWNRNLEKAPDRKIRELEISSASTSGPRRRTVRFTSRARGTSAYVSPRCCPADCTPRQKRAIRRPTSHGMAYAAAHGQLATTGRWSARVPPELPDLKSLRAHVAEWRAHLAGEATGDQGAARLHPEHGRRRPGPRRRAGAGVVRRRPADHRPAHYGVSPYAHGTGTEGGLFPTGRALLEGNGHASA